MSKIPVSVCIIAKNEEKYLEECLKRLKPYGFEIIVTDTGSTDHTVEIAKKYADRVYHFDWINDFSAARNFCAKKARNQWIFSIDCDEFVDKIDLKSLKILMQKMPKGVGTLRLKVLVYDKEGELQYTTEDVTRLYNKDYYDFQGAIHEQLTPFEWKDKNISQEEQILHCFLLPVEAVHQGYAQDKETMKRKQERNIDILLAALKKDEKDPYLYFQIGQSMGIIGELQKSIFYFEKALSFVPSPKLTYVQATIMGLAKAYMQNQQKEDAFFLMHQYENACKTAKFAFFQACMYHETGNLIKALIYYMKATTMEDADTLGVNLSRCYESIITLQKQFGNEKMADFFQKKLNVALKEKERVLSTAEFEKVTCV